MIFILLQFGILVDINCRRKLEDVIMLHDVGEILDMTCQPMAHFESCIWTKYGHLCENVKRVQVMLQFKYRSCTSESIFFFRVRI